MVLLEVKGIDAFEQFLYECSSQDSLDLITRDVISIHNLRWTLHVLCDEMKELIKYGPQRTDELKGLSDKIIKQTIPELKMEEQEYDFDLDPTARRIGAPIKNQNVILRLNELILKIENYLSVERVKLRYNGGLCSLSELNEYLNELRGGLLMAYPQQLPQYDILQQILMNDISLDKANINYSKHIYDISTAQLWFTSRKLFRCDKLNKYIGNNEKTKIVVKITKQNGNMPFREAPIDEKTRKQMMAYWYKKQEQDKQLKEDDDTQYLKSEWANTSSLKQSLNGLNPNKLYYK